ncbi:GNAT family N-acetyltransferase [Streptomyces sp. 8L]|uniref:GNAT family N-acetyltransferase n=1 Tax=Streptomyces sp. 8L TaxID=2877242 RepID=UPI001CD4E9B9|nr:GNAT family N-acetyltransferase [Streptomyces sp. 8L]MCA1219359.1 GNAT family N-acetyltransferase [Streptomyces sp. 8L]
MIVEPLGPTDGDLPGPVLTELAALYTSDHAFQQLSGEFSNPGAVRPEEVAASLADDLAHPGAEVLLARSMGRLVAVAVTLEHHPGPLRTTAPDPAPASDPDPWIALLMVHGERRRAGYGRRLADVVEQRFRDAGRAGVRAEVLEGNAMGLAFWTALGYEETGRRPDRRLGRPAVVLRKDLSRT